VAGGGWLQRRGPCEDSPTCPCSWGRREPWLLEQLCTELEAERLTRGTCIKPT